MRNKEIRFACTQKIEGAPEVIHLLPMGQVTSTKGDFVVDNESYHLMVNAMKKHGVDIVIDYEHQSLSGDRAPAAGWIKELILGDNAIDVRVEWTEAAAGYLSSGEYRYTSPVILARKSDSKACRLVSLALTNSPAIDGMHPIINSDLFDDDEGDDEHMDLKKLAEMLGLPETATLDDIMASVAALLQKCSEQENMVVNSMLAPLLGVEATADLPTVSAKVMALSQHIGFVPKDDYDKVKVELDRLQGDGMVELALSQGKITPAQKDWAQQYVLSNRDGFAKFLEHATAVVPMGETHLGKEPDKKPTEDRVLVCSGLGITPDEMKQYGGI